MPIYETLQSLESAIGAAKQETDLTTLFSSYGFIINSNPLLSKRYSHKMIEIKRQAKQESKQAKAQ